MHHLFLAVHVIVLVAYFVPMILVLYPWFLKSMSRTATWFFSLWLNILFNVEPWFCWFLEVSVFYIPKKKLQVYFINLKKTRKLLSFRFWQILLSSLYKVLEEVFKLSRKMLIVVNGVKKKLKYIANYSIVIRTRNWLKLYTPLAVDDNLYNYLMRVSRQNFKI